MSKINVKQYILELLRNDIYVFPIKGRGKTVEEAKRPMSFKEGDELITWKNEKILSYSEELARKNHQAWAVWLLRSKRFGIDIDVYKHDKKKAETIANRLKEISEVYSELSGRGGIHIILSVSTEKKYKLRSNRKWIEWKFDGYFIIYPTVLITPKEKYKYTKINGDLLNTEDAEFFSTFIPAIFDLEDEVEIVAEGEARSEVSVVGEAEDVRGDPRRRRPKLPDHGIFAKIKQEFAELQPWPHAVVALGLLALEAGCRGFAELLDAWTETGKIPIENEELPNGRGAHRTFESVLFVLLRELGYRVELAEGIADRIDYIDGITSTKPRACIVWRYDHQSIIPLNKMTCPYAELAHCWCASKPDWRIISWIKRHPDRALQIIRYVKRLSF